jgi:hypothetical protein
MSREERWLKLHQELEYLQTAFQQLLLKALRACAAGGWGLFGQNDHSEGVLYPRRSAGRNEADQLLALGKEITDLEVQLGLTERNRLFKRFLAYRMRRGSNDLGEPKLAKKFLEELAEGWVSPIGPNSTWRRG